MSRGFELNSKGVIELYKSGWMQGVVSAAGKAVATAAGEEYGVDPHLASFTAICTVYPKTFEARLDNEKNNTLLKACGSAGLRMKG